MKSEVTARAAAMGYCADQLNGVQEARRVKDKALTDPSLCPYTLGQRADDASLSG